MVLVFSTGTGTPSGTGTGTGSCTRTGTGTGTGIGTGSSTGSTGDGGGWGGVWGVPSLAGPYLNFITELIPLLIYIYISTKLSVHFPSNCFPTFLLNVPPNVPHNLPNKFLSNF